MLTDDQANAIWDVLVQHAGAMEDRRTDFVETQTMRDAPIEYRFQGGLGFGGKFWNDRTGRRVSAYREDVAARPERQQMIDTTNSALAELAR